MAAQPLIRRRWRRQPDCRAHLLLLVGAAAGMLNGCSGPHPFIREGDARSVEVTYYGDVATALPLAAQYCARFDRKPLLVDPGLDIATFECVSR